MAYTASDPRSTLATAPAATRPNEPNVAPQYFEFDRMEPSEVSDAGGRSWWTRSQAIVSCYTHAATGDVLERTGQPDEYVVLVADEGSTVEVTAGDETVTATGKALVVVPPGDSAVRAVDGGRIVRLFSSQSDDLVARCANAEFYATTPDPNVAPWSPWPDPTDGHRIRVYRPDDVEPEPGRFGRIYRCSTFMINWFEDNPGPRPLDGMSPHHHDDFEQLSLQLGGDYVHHIRTPWTPDMRTWRDDEHRHCTSPSITVIPPPSIHTSQSVGNTSHFLVDIFAPPRHDFSAKDGWVLNAHEYPTPS